MLSQGLTPLRFLFTVTLVVVAVLTSFLGYGCPQCGCSRSVAPIKAGFVARVGRRKTTT